MGSSPDRVKPKTMKFVFVGSPLSTHHEGERAKNGWLGISIVRTSEATCLPMNCCYSELALCKNPTKRVGLEQSGPHHHHLIEN